MDDSEELDVTCWMQVPGTSLLVPLTATDGPPRDWRIATEHLDTGLTVTDVEDAPQG